MGNCNGLAACVSLLSQRPWLCSFIGKAYAKVILGLLKDLLENPSGAGAVKGDLSQPVYIVEVGAGHGRFGYLVVQALLDMHAFLPKCST